jgi:lycopene cyclase domain-containing protein
VLWYVAATTQVLQEITMDQLYLWLNIGSLSVPFIFSFHPRLRFYRKWKSLAIGTVVMMAVFIPWDILFTMHGFWGFNPAYLLGISFASLPLEEWLFFICIPYACIFTHYALLELNPNFQFSEKWTNYIFVTLLTVLIILLWYYYDRWYTLVNFIYGIIILGMTFNYRKSLLRSFFATYLVILLPFFIVNGILTGSLIPDEVVWYNNAENMGIRMFTIPVEDTIYNLGMLLTVLLIVEFLEDRKVEQEILIT